MTESFDVVVIGAGPAGENAAGRAASNGLSTAIIESELIGGECSYWACLPSKALLRPGEVLAAVGRVPGAREAVTGKLDVDAVLAKRDESTSNWNDGGQVKWLESVNVSLVRGSGRLSGPRCVEVREANGEMRSLSANKAVVIATGSKPSMPPIPGLDSAHAWDSRAATSAKEVPRRLLIVGGGVVAVEMAEAWRSLGSEAVTVVCRDSRLLAREEPFASEEVAKSLTSAGIEVLFDTEAMRFERSGRQAPVTTHLSSGRVIESDEILVAIGRRPATDDIGLEAIGMTPGKAIVVDDQLRAKEISDGWLYAVGDVNGRAPLTHMGKYHGRLVGDHIAGKAVKSVADGQAVPRVVFTHHQVAAVGMTEAHATQAGLHTRTVTYSIGNVTGSYLSGDGSNGTAQVIVDEDERVLVGATFTGPGIAEHLQAATIAIVGRVTIDQLWHAVPSFPTVSEFWLRLLEEYGL